MIEIYFYIGRSLFGCAARPFHLTGVAIHLLNTIVLFLFAHTLTRRLPLALLAAVLFAVQPGHVETVAWVAAITDLLSASWYLLTLWLYLLFLERGGRHFYVLSLAAFAICLFTHEISATLLPTMIALEMTLVAEGRGPIARIPVTQRTLDYVPFAILLTLSLAVSVIVNSRSYLIREGHYAVGWHAVLHIIQYLLTLVVWERNAVSYLVVPLVTAVLLIYGTPRLRFALVWMLLALVPASFFTWGNVSRYVYLPAAGFSLLLADLVQSGHDFITERLPPLASRSIALAIAAAVAVRFAVFAHKAAAEFPERTRPYERFARALQRSGRTVPPGSVVLVDRADGEGLLPMYLNPAAEVVFCSPDIRVLVR